MLLKRSYTDFTNPNFGVYYDANGQVMATYQIKLGEDKIATLDEQHLYGASRLGIKKPNILLYDNGPVSNPPQDVYQNTLGETFFELKNYLGNVNAIITDRKLWNATDQNYEAVITTTADYYPFGMLMPDRHSGTDQARYLYNGMEHDPEVSGNGNSYTTEFRQYDPRLGRWKSLDPLMSMFPSMSPYCAFDNNPIYYTDPYGLSANGPDGDPIKKTGSRSLEGKNGEVADELKDLPGSGNKGGDVVKFEYDNAVVEYKYIENTNTTAEDGHWQVEVFRTDGRTWTGPVDKEAVLLAKVDPPAPELNNSGITPESSETQAGTEVKEVDTGITKKPVVTKKDSPKIEEKEPDPEPKHPPTVTSHAEFRLRDDWFEKGKQRDLAYSTLREVSNFLKENPNQKFAIHIYIHTGGKGKATDLVGGDDSFFSTDTYVTQYSGKSLKSLAWGRYVTVRDIIRRQSGIQNATFNFVPHYNSSEHKFVVKPVN